MCVPSLNEICVSIFEISHTQVKMYGGGGDSWPDVKPIYPQLLSGDIIKETELLQIMSALREQLGCKYLYAYFLFQSSFDLYD